MIKHENTEYLIELLELQNKTHYLELPTEEVFDRSSEQFKWDILKNYTVDNKNEGFSPVYESSEYIPLQKALTLRSLLSFLDFKYGNKLKPEFKERLRRNLKVLDHVLNSTRERGYSFTDEKPLCVKKFCTYGYTKNSSHGRLYSDSVSITQLSREFRYLLFEKLYHDIDIVNAHPSILFNYGMENNISCVTLSGLVKDRSKFYETVELEYKDSIGVEFTKKLNIKRLCLAVINSHKTKYKSSTLTNLSMEMLAIREHLRNNVYLGSQTFKSAIDFRMTQTSRKDEKVMLNKIQSLYCFDKETETILAFKAHFERIVGVSDSIVPFFDGLFILKNEHRFNPDTFVLEKNYNLEEIIESFNTTSKLKLSEKEIVADYKLLKKSSLNDFEDLMINIDTMNRSDLASAIESSGVMPDDMFEDILDTYCKYDNKRYKDVTFSYDMLLDLRRRSELSDNKFIDYSLGKETVLINPECME